MRTRLGPREPARRVEAEGLRWDDRAQGRLHVAYGTGAQRTDPVGAQLVEQGRRPGQRVEAARGDADDLAAGVGGVVGAFGVAQGLQAVDGLAGRLLGDAEPPPDLARGRPAGPDGLEREAVGGPQVRVSLVGQLGVEAVDEGAEPAEEEQGSSYPGVGTPASSPLREPTTWFTFLSSTTLSILRGAGPQ